MGSRFFRLLKFCSKTESWDVVSILSQALRIGNMEVFQEDLLVLANRIDCKENRQQQPLCENISKHKTIDSLSMKMTSKTWLLMKLTILHKFA